MAYQPDVEKKVVELDYSKANASTVGSLKSSLQAIARRIEDVPTREELQSLADALDGLK